MPSLRARNLVSNTAIAPYGGSPPDAADPAEPIYTAPGEIIFGSGLAQLPQFKGWF
jgi:hypothetical protein